MFKRTVLGRVTTSRVDDIGLWIEAQIDTAKQYMAAIRKLVAEGVVGLSTGSVSHLVERTPSKGGLHEILSWPIVELSLTPTPAEPRTIGVRELKSLAASDPALRSIAQEAESLAGGISVKDLPDTAFAVIDAGGVLDDEQKTTPRALRHLPHHDADGNVDHDLVREALSEARKSQQPPEVIAHLKMHIESLEEDRPDDGHLKQWARGVAPRLLTVSMDLRDLADDQVTDHKSLDLLGMDTNSGNRVQPDRLARLKAARAELDDVIKTATAIERGDDDQERAEWLRLELALLEL
jgi:hypothetical protein